MALPLLAAVLVGHSAVVDPRASDHPAQVEAQAMVPVTITSDTETWVSIENVFAPAKFASKKVTLPPGDYEVVGRRKGFRDVRHVLQIRPGTRPTELRIVCTESAQ